MKSILLFASILRIIFITAILSLAVYANAQSVAVNINGAAADPSAMLDISSTSKGFLPPRMTTLQRTGIQLPTNGLMVFDTDTKTYWYFSTEWKEINDAGGGSFSLPYSGVAETNFNVFSIHNTSNSFGSSAILGKSGSAGSGILPFYNMGVWGDNSGGIGVAGTSKTIGVFGGTGSADASGIGVMGVNYSNTISNGAVTGINNANGVAVYAESTGGGTAVYGKTTKQNGAAIFGINNAIQGRAIQGSATGTDGVAIYGEGGNSNSSSYAGFFRNSNAANTKDVVQIYNQGAGRGLLVDQVNTSNSDDVVEVRNSGTGKFLSLITGTGEIKTTIAKNGQINTDGNIYTEGDLYVNGLKGIVRNTYSNQMRMEVMQLTIPGGFHFVIAGEFISAQTVSFNFNTAFSSPPAVYRANVVTATYSPLELLNYRIYDVTTTGFKIEIYPSSGLDFTSVNTTFKFVAVGSD